jgi:Polyketide cyclase / dehydrase and lipid transport
MSTQDIDVTVTTPAEADTVYALLRDGATWPTWSPIGSFELDRPAADEPEGVGAVRIFRTPRPVGETVSVEQIVELIPDRRFSYVLISGLPLRGYRADVDLTPMDGGGTSIRWHSTFSARLPGVGPFYRVVLGRFVARVAQGLADHAASHPAQA